MIRPVLRQRKLWEIKNEELRLDEVIADVRFSLCILFNYLVQFIFNCLRETLVGFIKANMTIEESLLSL